MSLRITLPGTDFSGLGLPTLETFIEGFPGGSDLRVLALFADGAVGSPHPGPYLNSARPTEPLTLMTGRVAPLRQSFGLEVTDPNGLILQSSQIAAGSFTLVYAVRVDASGVAGHFPTFFASSEDAYPVSPTESHTNAPFPCVNFDARQVADAGTYGIYDRDRILVSGSSRPLVLSAATASTGDWAIHGLQIDTDNAIARHCSVSGGEVSVANPAIPAFFDAAARTGTFLFGAWPHSTVRPSTAPFALVGGFALYAGAISSPRFTVAIQAMARFMAARGASIPGF